MPQCTFSIGLRSNQALQKGYEALKQLLATTLEPWNVIAGCRDVVATDKALNDLVSSAPSGTTMACIQVDLCKKNQVTSFSAEVRKRLNESQSTVDVLLLCAGVMLASREEAGKFDQDYVVNFLCKLSLDQILLHQLILCISRGSAVSSACSRCVLERQDRVGCISASQEFKVNRLVFQIAHRL